MSVEERMYHEIYDAIMEHRLPPRKLTEHALCEIYATARHTVRKVFSQRPPTAWSTWNRIMAFIAAPSIDEAHAMFELRQILERAVLDKVGHSPNEGCSRAAAGAGQGRAPGLRHAETARALDPPVG